MAVWYISNAPGNVGDDNSSGQTPGSAWRTLARATASTYLFRPGDAIVLRCGGEYPGTLYPGGGRGFTERRLTLGYYGDGERPILTGYKSVLPSAWTLHAANIWKVAINTPANYIGNPQDGVQGANVGHLWTEDGVIHGVKRWSVAEMAAQWEFYSDEVSTLYVYSATNPGTLAGLIGAAVGERAVFCEDGLRLNGLEIKGYSGHGLSGANLRNFELTGSYLHHLGGGRLVSYAGNVRYGNGVEAWSGSRNVLVEGCDIAHCYDTALTMQGTGATPTNGWDDIWYRHLRLWKNTQSFEVWGAAIGDAMADAGSGLHRTGMEYVTAISTGGWGAEVRPDKDRSVHLLIYGIHVPDVDVKVRHCLFADAHDSLIARSTSGTTLPAGYVIDDCHVVLRPDQKIFDRSTLLGAQWDEFVSTYNLGTRNTIDLMSGAEPEDVADAMDQAVSALNVSAKVEAADSRSISQLFAKLGNVEGLADGLASSPAVTTYRTATSPTVTDNFALMLRFQATNYGKAPFQASILYTIGDDSTAHRLSMGVLSIQIVPDALLTVAGTGVWLDVVEWLPFVTGLAVSDFKAVVSSTAEGAVVNVDLYVNIGKDNFASLYYRPLMAKSNGGAPSTFQFVSDVPLITALPVALPGATPPLKLVVVTAAPYQPFQYATTVAAADPTDAPLRPAQQWLNTSTGVLWVASYTSSSAGWRPTGSPRARTAAPSDVPGFVGQLSLDSTNKMTYVALGKTASSDWYGLATRVAVPSSPTAAGATGQYATDASYRYECVAPNTWRRGGHGTWS